MCRVSIIIAIFSFFSLDVYSQQSAKQFAESACHHTTKELAKDAESMGQWMKQVIENAMKYPPHSEGRENGVAKISKYLEEREDGLYKKRKELEEMFVSSNIMGDAQLNTVFARLTGEIFFNQGQKIGTLAFEQPGLSGDRYFRLIDQACSRYAETSEQERLDEARREAERGVGYRARLDALMRR